MLSFLFGFVLIKFIFWLIIIVFVIKLFHRLRSGSLVHVQHDSKRTNNIDILRERYARGEIDAEEFQRRKDELNK